MHVHIHGRGIEIEKKKRDGELTFHERGVITFAERRGQDRALNGAAVHEDKLLRASLAADSSLPDQAANSNFCRGRFFDGEKTLDQLIAVEIANAFEQARGGGKLKRHAIVPDKNKRHLRMAGRLQVKLVLDVAALGVLRAP